MKKIVGIIASIFMALALVGGSAFLLHEVEKTSMVEEEISTKANGPTYNDYWCTDANMSSSTFTVSGGYVLIDSAKTLARFSYCVNNNISWTGGGLVGDSNFKLTQDIDLSAYYWTPIGFPFMPTGIVLNHGTFRGTFDGDGHEVSGMYVDCQADRLSATEGINIGLFGNLQGVVKNLTISGEINLYTTSTKYTSECDTNVGGLAGKTTISSVSSGDIDNCTSKVNIKYHRTYEKNYDFLGCLNVGGLVGYSDAYRIEKCFYSGSINFNTELKDNERMKKNKVQYRIGGIAGYNHRVSLKECVFDDEGCIYIYEPAYLDELSVGGITGATSLDEYGIYDCISQGTIRTYYWVSNDLDDGCGAVGGIVGRIDSYAANIYRCHNYSGISQECTGYPEFHVGGILGSADGGGDSIFSSEVASNVIKIQNCSNFGYIKNNCTEGTGGIVGTLMHVHGEVYYCVNYGKIETSDNVGHGGGIVGVVERSCYIANCLNYGIISSNSDTSGSIGGVIGTSWQSGSFKQHPSLVANCVTFYSLHICGQYSGAHTDATADGYSEYYNCHKLSSSLSRDEIVDFFNDSDNWRSSSGGVSSVTVWWMKEGNIFQKIGNTVVSIFKNAFSGDGQWFNKTIEFPKMNGVWEYHPNYGSDDALNNQFYISPVNDQSIVYKKMNTYTTKNAIMPLSATSKTIVKYYVTTPSGIGRKLFKQDDANVGTSRRYKSPYVDNDPNFTSYDENFPYYDQLVTLRGVKGTFNFFTQNLDNYNVVLSSYISVSQTGIGKISVSGNANANISAVITSYSRRMGEVSIVFKPKTTSITISESGATGGSVYLNSSTSKLTTLSFTASKYIYSDTGSVSIKVDPPANYTVKSISFGTSASYNTGLTSSDSSTREAAVGSFTASKSYSGALTFSSVTITYVSLYKDVYIYYKLPGDTNYTKNILNKPSSDIDEGGNISSTSATKVSNTYLKYKYSNSIYLNSNPGYYISSIKAKHYIDGRTHSILSDYTITSQYDEPIVLPYGPLAQGGGGITWTENGSLTYSTLTKFLQDNFFVSYSWDITNIYIDFAYTTFDARVAILTNPVTEQERVSAKCVLGGDITVYYEMDEYFGSNCFAQEGVVGSGSVVTVLGVPFAGYDYTNGGERWFIRIKYPSYLSGAEIFGAVKASELKQYDYSGPDVLTEHQAYVDGYNYYFDEVYKKVYTSAELEGSEPEPFLADKSTTKEFDVEFGYTYTIFTKITTSIGGYDLTTYSQLGTLGLQNTFASCITIEGLNAVLRLKLEDFFDTDETFFGSNYGNYAYKKVLKYNGVSYEFSDQNEDPVWLCVYLVKEPAEDLNITIKNMSRREEDTQTNLLTYREITNSTEKDELIEDVYGNPIGGTTYLSQIVIENDEEVEYKYLSTQLALDMTFHAIAMPGFVFKGISFDSNSQTPTSFVTKDNPYGIPTLAELINAAFQSNEDFDASDIDYAFLKNTIIYAYYDIAQYEIQITKQVDDKKDDPVKSNKIYFAELTINASDYSSSNLEFLGVYLLDGTEEKLLTLNTSYTFVNYNPKFIVTNEVYTALNTQQDEVQDGNKQEWEYYKRFEIADVHEKYILLTLKGAECYIKANPTSYLRILVKFATKPTSITAPTQQNNTIYISSTNDLVWLSNEVNGGNTFEGYIIKQIQNIDFGENSEESNKYYSKVDITKLYTGLRSSGQVDPSTLQPNLKVDKYTIVDLVEEGDNYYHIAYQGNHYYIKTPNYENEGNILFKYHFDYMSPIGTEEHPFKGTYDGQGFVIQNLKLTNGDVATGQDIGLFGYVENATIKNLTLIGGSVTGLRYVGAVAGLAEYSTFENVTNNGCEVKAITYLYSDIYGDNIQSYTFDLDNAPIDKYSFKKIDGAYNSYITYNTDRFYGGLVGLAGDCKFVGCGVRANITNIVPNEIQIPGEIIYNQGSDDEFSDKILKICGLIGLAIYDVDTTINTPIKECYYIGNLPISDNDILNSLAYCELWSSSLKNGVQYNSAELEQMLQVDIIQNCFYQTDSTRYYIINSNEAGEEYQIDQNKFSSDTWIQIGTEYELKTFYWA